MWFLVSDSSALIVSCYRQTGYIVMLQMLTGLKFSNLVLPTVTLWLIIQMHSVMGTVTVLFERKRRIGQRMDFNERLLKGSSFSGVESWSLADPQSWSCTASALPWKNILLFVPTGYQTPPGRSWGVPVCSSVAHDKSPLSRSGGTGENKSQKLIRLSLNFTMKGWKGRSWSEISTQLQESGACSQWEQTLQLL